MGKKHDNDIHERHQVPRDDEEFDVTDKRNETPPQEPDAPAAPQSDTPNFSWPGKTAKDQQAIRDSFYKENGVRADLTGGTVPESE